MGTLPLAFLGDAVFELMVREQLLDNGSMPVGKLHSLSIKKVSAVSQAKAYDTLDTVLNDDERSILKRGRNSSSAKVPKSSSVEDYRKATAIEALFGYLHLKGDADRLAEVFKIVDDVISSKG